MAQLKQEELTPLQREAVERDGIVCVLAGAGSGKTKVLTHKYLRLLKQGIKPNQILALTFTEKAAWEMKEKIRDECSKDAELKKKIDPIEIELAPISTFHSFCASLLKQNALELGFDPNFSIISEVESKAIAFEVVDDLLVKWRQEPERRAMLDVIFGRLFSEASEEPTKRFRENIISIWDKLRATGDLQIILSQRIKDPKYIDKFFGIEELKSKDLKDLIPKDLDEDNKRKLAKIIERARDLIERREPTDALEQAEILFEIQSFLEPFNFQGNDVKSEALYQAAALAFRTQGWLLSDAYSILADFLKEFDEELFFAKRKLGVADFSDLECWAYKALVEKGNDRFRNRVVGRYKYILVDELQDTSPIQMKILSELVGLQEAKPEFFGVGDFGQSIYGFRHAEPELFKIFAQVSEELKDNNRGGQIRLDKNFRSYQEILDWVKLIVDEYFEFLAREKGKMKGWNEDELKSYKPFFQTEITSNNGYSDELETPLEILLVKKLEEQREDEIESENESAYDSTYDKFDKFEASVVAKRIKEIVERGDIKDGIKYGDIVVLFRKREPMRIFKSAFEQHGIPVVEITGSGFFESAEIRDVYHLLRLLDNPYDRFDLACVLASPILSGSDETCGISEDALLHLFVNADCKNKEPFDLIIEGDLPSEISASDKEKLEQFAKLWGQLKDKLCAFPPDRIVAWLLKQSGYWQRAQEDDPRRIYNLNKLFSFLKNLKVFGGNTFYSIWRALGEFIENEISEEMASPPIEASDSVRFMTVHAAKGLEFRCVIVANTNKGAGRDRTANFRVFQYVDLSNISPNDFLGVKNITWNFAPFFNLKYGKGRRNDLFTRPEFVKLPKISDYFKTFVSSGSLRDTLEGLRLLYVAMTRAKEKLIISGALGNKKASYNTFLGMILPALKRLVGDFNSLTSREFELKNSSGRKLGVLRIYNEKDVESFINKPETVHYCVDLQKNNLIDSEKILPISIPRIISLAHLNRFIECPRRFYWESLAGELARKGKIDSGIEYGLLFHRAVAIWNSVKFKEEDLATSIDRALQEFNIKDEKVRSRLEKELEQFAGSGITRLALDKGAEFFCERDLSLSINGYILHGRPDLIVHNVDKKCAWVIDYKTDAISNISEGAESYRVQALGYGLALSKIFEGESIDVLLYFTAISQVYKGYDLRDAEKIVREALEKFVKAHRSFHFEPNPKDNRCRFCTYPNKTDCIGKGSEE